MKLGFQVGRDWFTLEPIYKYIYFKETEVVHPINTNQRIEDKKINNTNVNRTTKK